MKKQKNEFYNNEVVLLTLVFGLVLLYSLNGLQKNIFLKSASTNACQLIFRIPVIQDTSYEEGHSLISRSDCFGCHAVDKVVTAPSYMQISTRYKNDRNALSRLTNKVIAGGRDVWGDREMPAHQGLLREDVQKMVLYILHLSHNDKLQQRR